MGRGPILFACTLTWLSLLMIISSAYGSDQVILYDGVGTRQLSFHWGGAESPRITNSGYVVWSGWTDAAWTGSQKEVFLYYDGTVTRLTYSEEPDQYPEVNESGLVVWVRGSDSIFFYDGTSTMELSDSSCRPHASARPASINDHGHVVWSETVSTGCEIFLYDGTNVSQISPDDDYVWNMMPHISDNGHIVWYGRADADYEVFLYDGTTTSQITDNDFEDRGPFVTNSGHVVWGQDDGTDSEILLYNGTEIIPITDNSHSDQAWRINDSGQIVWLGGDVFELDVFFYDGESILQLTDTDMGDLEPDISNSGLAVWRGRTQPVTAIYEIFMYDGSSVIQLTDDGVSWSPRVNDGGQVVWLSPRTVAPPLWTAATLCGKNAPYAAMPNGLLVLVVPFAAVMLFRLRLKADDRAKRSHLFFIS